MHLFIKSVGNKTVVIDCELSDTFLSVKNKFFAKEKFDIPDSNVGFIFGSKYIYDYDKTLEEHNINENSTIYMNIKMKGQCHICSDQTQYIYADNDKNIIIL